MDGARSPSTPSRSSVSGSNASTNLSQFGWYHGRVDRAKTEALLSSSPVGTFLVRDSSSIPGDYVISASDDKAKGGCTHYIVNFVNGRYFAGEVFFPSLPAVIEHYKQNTLGRCNLGDHVPISRSTPLKADEKSGVDNSPIEKNIFSKMSKATLKRPMRAEGGSRRQVNRSDQPSPNLVDDASDKQQPPALPERPSQRMLPGERGALQLDRDLPAIPDRRPTVSPDRRSTIHDRLPEHNERRHTFDRTASSPMMATGVRRDNMPSEETYSEAMPVDDSIQDGAVPAEDPMVNRRTSVGGVSLDSTVSSTGGFGSIMSGHGFPENNVMDSIDEASSVGPSMLKLAPEEATLAIAVFARTVNAYDPTQLVFEVGDQITVLEQKPSGTWSGECNGLIGHFPFTAVQLCRQ